MHARWAVSQRSAPAATRRVDVRRRRERSKHELHALKEAVALRNCLSPEEHARWALARCSLSASPARVLPPSVRGTPPSAGAPVSATSLSAGNLSIRRNAELARLEMPVRVAREGAAILRPSVRVPPPPLAPPPKRPYASRVSLWRWRRGRLAMTRVEAPPAAAPATGALPVALSSCSSSPPATKCDGVLHVHDAGPRATASGSTVGARSRVCPSSSGDTNLAQHSLPQPGPQAGETIDHDADVDTTVVLEVGTPSQAAPGAGHGAARRALPGQAWAVNS
jgi:hypothetical protein